MKKLIVLSVLFMFGIAANAQLSVSEKGYIIRNLTTDEIYSVDGVLFMKYYNYGTTLVKYPQNKSSSSYTIPNKIRCIAKGAFQGNKYIRTIRIPSSVRSIGDNAFDGCDQLTSIEIYESTNAVRTVEAEDSPSEAREVGRYNIQGVKVQEDEDGKVQIILYSNGTSQKILNK